MSYASSELYAIRHDKNISAGAKVLFEEIIRLSYNGNSYCWAGNKYFSHLTGASEKNIEKRLNELKKYGYIHTEETLDGKRYIFVNTSE